MIWPAEESGGSRKTFLEHLEDLRKTLVRSLIALVVGMIIAVPAAPYVLKILKIPLARAGKDPEAFLKVFNVLGGFNLSMLIVMLSGLLISAPFIVFFIAGFIFPGLTKKERSVIVEFSGVALLLFIGGVCMGYFLMLPVALDVLFGVGKWIGVQTDFVSAADYVTFCLYLLLAFGLSFELPVVLVALGYMGLIGSKMLRSARAYAVVIILLFAMVVTPTTDMFSMLMMALPMIFLYEVSIWIIWYRERYGKKDQLID